MRECLLFLLLAVSAWWDKKTGKIPNRWILCGMAGYLLLCLLRALLQEDGLSAGGNVFFAEAAVFSIRAALFIAISFPLFMFRMMGAGDIKLMAVICGWLGARDGFSVIIYGLAASAVWSLFYMVKNHIFLKRIRYFINYFKLFFQTGQRTPYYLLKRDGRQAAFCFAPYLLGGFCLWLAI